MCLQAVERLYLFVVPSAPIGSTLHDCGQRCKVTVTVFMLMLQYAVNLCCVSGGPSQWPVGDSTDPPVCRRTAGRHSESAEDHNSDASLHCSY